ncbi:hypothetical protein RDV78_07500 [Bacillota bacterium LX-D]|nr:hypothetical protein [Bacillota bacterium LX-D]
MSYRQNQPIELECRPELREVVCRFGEKCFHDTHYICKDSAGNCLPADACPFDAVVSGLTITSVTPSDSCAQITGTYDIDVFFRFDNQRRVGVATRKDAAFTVQVPLGDVNECFDIFCEDGPLPRRVCVFNTRLEVIEAALEPDDIDANICPRCEFRFRVVVEKIFRAFEHALQVVCAPVCSIDVCQPAPTTESPFCPPFTNPTECPSFCEEDEVFNPDNCNTCPPPQVTPTTTPTAN